ncbi:glycosyltransferase [Paenibacillus sp. USDA918EY]|uniref:glycosyltransferase n=1 Tax=Paenibacillus sp. USDA918EY TaxID=2689575 RepID=UPI0013582514|nr:glycosyltransferase [Paenibacillus sp. USDA918EY]
MRPLVSIVIPFYNDPYVDQAVQSALMQTYSPLEIIVVDDGSTMHADRLHPYRNHIHYLGKANGGTASALNHGIRHSSGQYIAWLSSDDVFYPGKIDRQIHFMLDRGAWISHTNFNYIDARSRVVQLRAGMTDRGPVDFYRSFLGGNPVNGCTVMMKKEMFCYVGLFDESLPYTHDLEFWARIIQARIPFPYLDEALTGYRWHEGMGTLRHRHMIEREYAFTQDRVQQAMTPLINLLR